MSDSAATGRIFALYHDIHESELGAQPAGEGAVLGSGLVYVRWYYPPRGEEYADMQALTAYTTELGMIIEWPETVEHERKELPE